MEPIDEPILRINCSQTPLVLGEMQLLLIHLLGMLVNSFNRQYYRLQGLRQETKTANREAVWKYGEKYTKAATLEDGVIHHSALNQQLTKWLQG